MSSTSSCSFHEIISMYFADIYTRRTTSWLHTFYLSLAPHEETAGGLPPWTLYIEESLLTYWNIVGWGDAHGPQSRISERSTIYSQAKTSTIIVFPSRPIRTTLTIRKQLMEAGHDQTWIKYSTSDDTEASLPFDVRRNFQRVHARNLHIGKAWHTLSNHTRNRVGSHTIKQVYFCAIWKRSSDPRKGPQH